MIREHERVVLRRDFPEHGLCRHDVGTVIHVHRDGSAFEVEFLTLRGDTVVVATLSNEDLRAVRSDDITHARPLATGD